MAASVPERCPQCHSPVAERFPHAVMYDCGCSLFNDGQPVTDDYPAECQRRRIKRLEKQLAAALAEAERWRKKYEALEAGVVRELIEAATRYLAVTTRESDDDPNCWAEEEFAKDRLREVLAKVWGVRRDG